MPDGSAPRLLPVNVITLGCKVNQFESEAIAMALETVRLASTDATAGICLINTCTVTQKASMQSRQAIRKTIREHPDDIIVATGCYAQSEPEALKKIAGLDYIISNADKHRIIEILAAARPLQKNPTPVMLHHDIRREKYLHPTLMPVMENRTRPFIKIQDGCDHFCTYCIVPYTRGPSRSTPPAEVLKMIRSLPLQKRQEIVLTGIHLGKYGLDLTPETSLKNLLQQIHHAAVVNRVRLSSVEPLELTDDLLDFADASGLICPHFHIPLQSGDDGILKAMHRPYDTKYVETLVQKIHTRFPDAAIGVDILAGFPGETETAFTNTFRLLAGLPITYLHVFPFSPRPGTPAFHFPHPVAADTVKKRRNTLLNLSRQKKTAFYTKMTGRILDVLIENRRDLNTGKLSGVSANYVRVLADGDDRLKNTLVPCRITGILRQDAVSGEPCL